MDIVFLYIELYNFLFCRDEIYIAPSGVQKERIKVIFKIFYSYLSLYNMQAEYLFVCDKDGGDISVPPER